VTLNGLHGITDFVQAVLWLSRQFPSFAKADQSLAVTFLAHCHDPHTQQVSS
jgi:hypothetical protein